MIQQIVGALWYLFAIERRDTCWYRACYQNRYDNCDTKNLYCAHEVTNLEAWKNISATFITPKCEITDQEKSPFKYGIYAQALSSGVLDSEKFVSKYFYCLWWGLQNLRYISEYISYIYVKKSEKPAKRRIIFSSIFIYYYAFVDIPVKPNIHGE